ncbi:EAL domain-containing protein [Allohahella marinimesophila]|uniref:EAL domain-containing protein n=1 Tax=Allohahella marinimesophila TaxID=1054972 RepID=A0ABP7PMG6_9GAMM
MTAPEAFAASSRPVKAYIAAVLVGFVVLLLWFAGIFERAEYNLRDRYVAALVQAVPSEFVIVEIDASSIGVIGRWPWSRELYAQAADVLGRAGVRSLSIDVDLSARARKEDDEALAIALRRLSQKADIRLPTFLQHSSLTTQNLVLRSPLPDFADSVDSVSVNMQPESDGLVRFLTMGFRWEGRLYPSAWNVMAGNLTQATWIDFSIAPESFTYVSFADLIDEKIDPALLSGRDIIIGSTAIELGDNLAVPVYQVLPGVVIQALGAETLKRGGLYKLGDTMNLLLMLLSWLMAALVLLRLSWQRSLQLLLAVGLFFIGGAILSYKYAALMIDVVTPLLMWVSVFVGINLARLDAESVERLWLQISLRDNQKLLDLIVGTANDSIICVNAEGIITRVNPAAQKLCGSDERSLLGTSIFHSLPAMTRNIAMLPPRPFDTLLVQAHSVSIPVQATVSRVDLSAEPLFTLLLRDLRERVAREQVLQYQADHDKLTGLLNRAALFRQIDSDLENQPSGFLIAVDIDYFREVNDTYGHVVGDRLLYAVGERLVGHFASIGIAARVGGNDFAIWCAGADYAQGGQAFCRSLLETLEGRFELDTSHGIELNISVTLGISENKCSREDAESLLRKAGDALLMARRAGHAMRCYSEADQQAASRRLELVPAIRTAIRQSDLTLMYQPKVDLHTLEIYGTEALLRWPRRNGAVVPVDVLIEVAENSRQIAPLTGWVVETILGNEAEWERAGLPRHIAINLSARLFQEKNFIAGLKDLLASSSGYYKFEMEMTETALAANPQQALGLITELLDSGMSLAIDDYGTGYSSLAYLRDLRANVLKIDKSFITNIDQREESQVIVQSTIRMAHDLGLKVVAEGIETMADQNFLCKAGCDIGQGYLYAKPLTQADLEVWCEQWQQHDRKVRRG